MDMIPRSVGNFACTSSKILPCVCGEMEWNSFLWVMGLALSSRNFCTFFYPKKFTPMLEEMDTGDLDDPESLYTKRQKQR